MELTVVDKWNADEQHLKRVNKCIRDRIHTLISKYYTVIPVEYKDKQRGYLIYKKLNFESKIINEYLFNIIHFIWPDKYLLMGFIIKDNVIEVNANNPTEVELYKMLLNYWFNSMEDVEIKIIKQYCEWSFK